MVVWSSTKVIGKTSKEVSKQVACEGTEVLGNKMDSVGGEGNVEF